LEVTTCCCLCCRRCCAGCWLRMALSSSCHASSQPARGTQAAAGPLSYLAVGFP
jgi:hypothetical protein